MRNRNRPGRDQNDSKAIASPSKEVGTWRRRGHSERTLAFCFALALTLLTPAALADDPPPLEKRILIVRSSGVSVYRTAEEQCRSTLTAAGMTVRSSNLEDWLSGQSRGAARGERTDLFIAIGSKAARALAGRLPAEADLIYCLVSAPKKLGLLDRPRTWGVSTQVTAKQRIEFLAAALPGNQRLGVLHSATEQGIAMVEELRSLLPEGWQLEAQQTEERNFVLNLASLLTRKPTILVALPDSRVFTKNSSRVLLKEAYRERVPVYAYSRGFVAAGALLGTAIEPSRQGARAGALALLALEADPNPNARHECAQPVPLLNESVLEILDLELVSTFLEKSDVVRVGREGKQ